MCGTDPGRPPSRRSTAVPRLMLVAVLTGETCEIPYRSPSFVDRRSSSRSPGHTFLERVSSDSAVPPFPAGPLFIQVPGGSCGIITTGHRGHGAIVPNGRTCRHFLTNPSYFMCRRAGVVGWHLERRRARPGPPTRCCRTRSGRGRCARDTPSRRGDPGFGGLPLLQPEDPAAPAAPSTPAAARRRVLGPRANAHRRPVQRDRRRVVRRLHHRHPGPHRPRPPLTRLTTTRSTDGWR